ncbi:class F sortase [Gordonia shandongensis]|uniref:class F sortase n=1 Tax=Gordonia shandongensis TaxID=376351 RepID=UPI0004262519|nr:class F sortase [Gordonia shandongensis]
MHRLRRLLGVTVAVATVTLAVACGTEQNASDTTHAQENLRPPVSAVSHDPSTPTGVEVGGAHAATDAVATDAEGTLLPPTDIARLGWWVDSALPGSGTGTVVVAGHVDDAQQGTGFAARFAELSPGDTVTVDTTDGARHRYSVTRVVDARKEGKGADAVPFDELNRMDGPETLALVTCGGPFVGPPLGYRDNIVVFARPA